MIYNTAYAIVSLLMAALTFMGGAHVENETLRGFLYFLGAIHVGNFFNFLELLVWQP